MCRVCSVTSLCFWCCLEIPVCSLLCNIPVFKRSLVLWWNHCVQSFWCCLGMQFALYHPFSDSFCCCLSIPLCSFLCNIPVFKQFLVLSLNPNVKSFPWNIPVSILFLLAFDAGKLDLWRQVVFTIFWHRLYKAWYMEFEWWWPCFHIVYGIIFKAWDEELTGLWRPYFHTISDVFRVWNGVCSVTTFFPHWS